jgi:hypothetical protein
MGSVKIIFWILSVFILGITTISCALGTLSTGFHKIKPFFFDQRVVISAVLSASVLFLILTQLVLYERRARPSQHVLDLLKTHQHDSFIIPLEMSFTVALPDTYKPKYLTSFDKIENDDITTVYVLLNNRLYKYPCVMLYERYIILKPENAAFKKYVTVDKKRYYVKGFKEESEDIIEAYDTLSRKFG